MKSIEEVRQAVMSLFKTVHTANHSALVVNYPNLVAVDLEHLTGPFISVEITAGETAELDSLGEDDVLIEGTIFINYLLPSGKGTAGAAAYSDTLKNNMCNRKIAGVVYGPLRVFSVSPYPGIVGQSNKISFRA